MSDRPTSSLFSSLWRVVIAALGIVVAVWVAVTLIEQIWVTLLIILGVIVVITAAVILLRWWLLRRRL